MTTSGSPDPCRAATLPRDHASGHLGAGLAGPLDSGFPPCSRRPPRRARAATISAAALLPVFAAVFAAPVHAQTVTTFVSNIGQADTTTNASISSTNFRAQQFTTGSSAVTLSEVVINIRAADTGTAAFAIYTSTASDEPGTKVVDLTGSSATAGEQSFTPASTTTLSASTKYFVYCAMSSGNGNLQRTSSNTIDAGATAGWDIADNSVLSTDSGGSWSSSGPSIEIAIKGTSSTTAPGAPTGLTAGPNGQSQIDLSWTAPSDNGGAAITGYQIEVSDDNRTTWTDLDADTGSTDTTHAHTGLSAGTVRHYRVSAINSAGTGAASNVARGRTRDAPTAVPSNWSLNPAGSMVGDSFRLLFLSSGKRDGASADIDDYNTFIQNRALGGDFDIRAHSAAFRVVGCTVAVDARDNTATIYSDDDKGVPIYWLNGNKVADDYEDFYDGDWDEEQHDKNASGNNGPNTSQSANKPFTGCGHDGTEKEISGLSSALGRLTPGVGSPNSTDSGLGPLSNGSTQNTNTRPFYGLSPVFKVSATAATVPGAPTGLLADGTSQTQVDLFWTAPSDTGMAAVRGYRVEVSTDGTSWTDASADTGSDETTYSHTGLSAGDVRHYRVSAINSVGTGAASAAARTITATADGTFAVSSAWALKPSAVAAGGSFRLLFLSSTKRDSSSTDIDDYNTFIHGRAAAGHSDIQLYASHFKAVGCTASDDARDNTSTTYTTTEKGVPIYWLNGTKAADDYEDFYDGSWDDEANDKNESGTDGPDTSQGINYPLTGCAHDGTEAFFAGTSHALGAANSRLGRPSSTDTGTGPLSTSGNTTSGSATQPMYGLSPVFKVPAAPDQQPAGIRHHHCHALGGREHRGETRTSAPP